MKDAPAKVTHLEDYKTVPYVVEKVDLTFDLHDTNTIVTAKTAYRILPERQQEPLVLHGEELKLNAVSINGVCLNHDEYSVDTHSLTIHTPPSQFVLEVETEINPLENTALDGLYKSNTIFCTQNEPEGFRKITYFLDRPDIMSVYTTKIIADKEKYPILLSNGNEIDKGDLPEGKHFVCWHDPFPKPCYLYALVAGDLGMIQDTFQTMSGREIDLRIYCDKGNEGKCLHAMRSLKKAMKWDEEVFGLEYDLDIFMIVAVDAFNFGAMENKGLNIFNTSCALADEKSATDDNFYRIEGVIAHEYFHNWTGNRVTCRDWFQLTLKEGLTVFRDQEFSSDMNSRAVKRIEDVSHLRAFQFSEDAGPTSHPIKPKSYMEINNFYTMTIYEKGAEVIRMLQTLLGKEKFRKGIDKYFELYDGQAVTTEDFLYAMQEVSDIDLKGFSKWYYQSGTPEVKAYGSYLEKEKEFRLTLCQHVEKTADQKEKEPLVFPFKVGLIGPSGEELCVEFDGKQYTDGVTLQVSKESEEFVFKNVEQKPVVSLNRDFSAPVKVVAPYSNEDLMFLLSYDKNAFNHWDASQELALKMMDQMLEKERVIQPDPGYLDSIGKVLQDTSIDDAFKAFLLTIPSESTLGQRQKVIDFDGNHTVREALLKAIAQKYVEQFYELYFSLNQETNYSLDAKAMGRRRLKNICLSYLVKSGQQKMIELCFEQFKTATNMTDQFAALHILSHIESPLRASALEAFYKEWKNDPLVMCKWLLVQTSSKLPGAIDVVKNLMQNAVFNEKVPNLVRALLGGFLENHVQFHDVSGQGYAFIADQVIALDQINPQIAAYIASAFKKVEKLDVVRQPLMIKQLQRIVETPELSPNVYEVVSKCLKPWRLAKK